MPSAHRLKQMSSQDPALNRFYEDVVRAGHLEELDNKERGCGHLDHNAAYVRSDVDSLGSDDGEIPPFVELKTPIEYREYSGRGAIMTGWKIFPGVEFSLAYQNEGYGTNPPGEIDAHVQRLREDRLLGDHFAKMTPANATDILMSVGKTHYPTPSAFVEECLERGLNLKVGSGPSNDPPVVNPMRTRCWVIHPHGIEEDRAGIIGYATLTRTVYTTGENVTEDDPDIPQYAEEWVDAGRVNLATPGPEVPAEPEDEVPETPIDEFGSAADDGADAEAVEDGRLRVLTTEDGADHILAPDSDETSLCGRDRSDLEVYAEADVADKQEYMEALESCGTCLTALSGGRE